MSRPINYRRLLKILYPQVSSTLADIITRENAKKPTLPKWRQTQLIKFIHIINMMTGELERAHRQTLMPTLAWSARCLLELSIWTEYCCASQENAKRFRDDAARDLFGMSKATMALIKHATGSQDDDPGLTAAMNRLGEFVKKWGINKLEDDFKRVVSAASELGKEKAFVSNNKYLSKLAHPTAWVVNSVTSLEADTMVRDQILKDAVLMARQSLLHIRDLVLTTFPKPGHEHELDL